MSTLDNQANIYTFVFDVRVICSSTLKEVKDVAFTVSVVSDTLPNATNTAKDVVGEAEYGYSYSFILRNIEQLNLSTH